jgi:hypothetical protein
MCGVLRNRQASRYGDCTPDAGQAKSGHSKRFDVLVNPGSALADREIAARSWRGHVRQDGCQDQMWRATFDPLCGVRKNVAADAFFLEIAPLMAV